MEWTLGNIVTVVIITLTAIILIISLFGPKLGLLNKAAEKANKIAELWLPTKPSERLKPTIEADIPEELKKDYDSLIEAFEIGINAKAPCLIGYNLPDDFKDYKIKIERGDKLYFYILKEDQSFKNREFNIKICITSGKKNNEIVAQNFYLRYIKNENIDILNTFNEIDSIIIENNKQLNLEYDIRGYFLYKSNDEYICFLTTDEDHSILSEKCEGGKEQGLDDDCLKDLPNDNIKFC